MTTLTQSHLRSNNLTGIATPTGSHTYSHTATAIPIVPLSLWGAWPEHVRLQTDGKSLILCKAAFASQEFSLLDLASMKSRPL
jgi:hypothetical protein